MHQTYTAIALETARQAATNPLARLTHRHLVDAARDELVAAGAPEAAERVVQACMLLANPKERAP